MGQIRHLTPGASVPTFDLMTKRERICCVLRGDRADRVPVSFWHHFPPEAMTGQPAVDAHLTTFERFDLDFLKIMNDHPYPRVGFDVIASTADLAKIRPMPGDGEGFAPQLDVIRKLRAAVGSDVLACTTSFNAWTTLRKLTVPVSHKHSPPKMDGTDDRDETLTRFLKEDRAAVRSALEAIGQSLANFAKACVDAGADGLFLSVRDDWVDRSANGEGTYAELVRPTDLAILDAVKGAPFNVLHMCGKPVDFRGLANYPVHVLNWADRAAGPSVAYARDRAKPVIMGGVDNLKTLVEGSPDDVAAQVHDALRQSKNRPMIVSPGCTFDPGTVPEANLRAMVDAARAA